MCKLQSFKGVPESQLKNLELFSRWFPGGPIACACAIGSVVQSRFWRHGQPCPNSPSRTTRQDH